jgi:hypothetical protein
MFCTPERKVDDRGIAAWHIFTWRFSVEQEGEHVDLPITTHIGAQVIGDGAVTLQASIDRRHWSDVATLTAGLHTLPLCARYIRANGNNALVHVMVGVMK